MLRIFSGRFAFCALVLATCSFSGLAETPTALEGPVAAAPPTDNNFLPMRFELLTEGPADACTGPCRQLVAAAGMLTADTPRQFLAFVRDNAPQTGAGSATVVLESDGGSVLGAIDLGRAIRRLGFSTSVGRVIAREAKGHGKYGEINTHADCQSMCTFVLLGGIQRQVPLDARVLVHQIWLGDRRDDAVAASYSAEDLVVVQRDIGSLVQYTAEMGGDVELVSLSLKVPPWEPMRVLTREELRRTRLEFSEPSQPAPVLIKTAAGSATSTDDEAHLPIEGRGWLTVNRGGQPTVARTHPLTVEGERIGSFDLLLACGPSPETYTLIYREARFGPADRGVPRSITQITVTINDLVQPLRIASSEKKLRRGEIDSVATAVLPARLVRNFAAEGAASMTFETDSVGNPRTVIRVGNAGFGRNFRDLDKSCGQRAKNDGTKSDVHAQIETRSERTNVPAP